jgi:flagellar biosynthesis anti-sigma factor FlgM
MRIDSNTGGQPIPENQPADNSASARVNTSATPVSSGVSSPLGEDQAQLSGVHGQIQALVAHVLQLPEIKQEKVQALRQAVVAGKYQPSADQVAGALFSNLAASLAA